MNKKNNILLLMLVMSSILVALVGCYLKYVFLAPFELYREDFAVAVPFLLMTDKPAQANIRAAMNPTEPTDPPTEPPTELTTEAPTENVEQETEVPTEPPTEAPTEPIVITESWFDDALFIGDSRCQTMSAYAPLGEALYFGDAGVSIFDVRYKRCYVDGLRMPTLSELFDQRTYGKIYIALGVNGMYYPHEDIIREYQLLIDLIKEKQPDAIIIIHSIMTVNRAQARSREYYSMENLYGLNEKLSELAVGDNMFYIDINEVFADEEGYLPDDMSHDGIHLYIDYYKDWAQWLMDTAATFGVR